MIYGHSCAEYEGVYEQLKRKSSRGSPQSNQHLCYFLLKFNDDLSLYNQTVKFLYLHCPIL